MRGGLSRKELVEIIKTNCPDLYDNKATLADFIDAHAYIPAITKDNILDVIRQTYPHFRLERLNKNA